MSESLKRFFDLAGLTVLLLAELAKSQIVIFAFPRNLEEAIFFMRRKQFRGI